MGRAAYIDTEGSFRPERIKQIAGRFNLDAETVCQNVRRQPPPPSLSLLASQRAPARVRKQPKRAACPVLCCC